MADNPLRSVLYGDNITGGLTALSDRVLKSRREFLFAVGLTLEAAIKEEYSTPGQGRIRRRLVKYRRASKTAGARYDIARATRASAPGDPPAPDTGQLRNSVHTSWVAASAAGHKDIGHVKVSTNAPQAAALEFGTTTAGASRNVTILPRPAWRPAIAKVKAAMGQQLAGVLRIVSRVR